MSTQPALSAVASAAPWRETFLKHINSMSQATFVLSTLHPLPAASESTTPSPAPAVAAAVVPRARTCICRGLWASLPANDKNPAPRNPAVWESDLPVLTTDVRMEKAGELGVGGGPVEAVWWVEGPATQWRVRGTAWVLGPDVEGEEGVRAREAILGRMRRGAGEAAGEAGWSWKREVTAHFGNLSPIMRGTFRSPPPGTPVAIPPEDGFGLGQEVDDLDDEIARSNFRVVVIVPTEVDQVDLSDRSRPRRWLYTYRGRPFQTKQPGGEVIGDWEKVEVWP